MRPSVLGPVRHRCVACGGGCFGTDVLVADAERAQLEERAVELGVDEPFDGTYLRKENGRCVFLNPDRRCAIHMQYGLEAKPLVCRQYPLFVRQVGLEARLGVDPGCLHAWDSWRDGPDVAEGTELARSRGGQPMAWNTEERALVQLAHPGRRTFTDVMDAISDRGLPRRLATQLIDARIGGRVAHEGTAASLRESLDGVTTLLGELDPNHLPEIRIPLDEWTVEVIRRMVWLRLPADARPASRALGVIAGALVCGWAHEEPADYGRALAAWTRVIRTPVRLLLWPNDHAVRHTLDPEGS